MDTTTGTYGTKGCTVDGCKRKHAALGLLAAIQNQGPHRIPAHPHSRRSQAIRRLRAEGKTMPELARQFECSVGTIERICSRRSFPGVD